MNGSELIMRSLAALGVRHVFACARSGAEALPFSPDDDLVRLVVCSSAAAAAQAADGYGRAAASFGVARVRGGCDAASAAGAIAAARADAVAMMLLTEEPSTELQDSGARSDAGGVDADGRITQMGGCAFSHIVARPSALPRALRDALRMMLSDLRQPVHLGLPTDVLDADIADADADPGIAVATPRVLDADAFNRYGREVLSSATRVALLVGGGAIESEASDALIAAAEQLQIPVATTVRGKGAIPEDHPLCLGVFGPGGHVSAEDCLTAPDLDTLLVVGSSLLPRDGRFANQKVRPLLGVAQVNLDGRVIGRSVPVRYRVIGDARTALEALRSPIAPWARELRETCRIRRLWADGYLHRPRFPAPDARTCGPTSLRPAHVIRALRSALPRDAALVVDSGAHRTLTLHDFPVLHPRRLFSASSSGPTGWALATATGVAAALPSTPVAVVTGDDGMLASGTEIQTAARHRLRILYVVFHKAPDARPHDLEARGAVPALPLHDWAGFAAALGVTSVRASTSRAVTDAFARFLAEEGPLLVEVCCERDAPPPTDE